MARLTRRRFVQTTASVLAVPYVWRLHGYAAPSETVLHASFGAGGMAASDINALTASKHLRLVAVAEVDESRLGNLQERFPHCTVYKDYRQLLDKEKKSGFGQRLHSRSYACSHRLAGYATRLARVLSKAAHPYHSGSPLDASVGYRKETYHPNGHSDS